MNTDATTGMTATIKGTAYHYAVVRFTTGTTTHLQRDRKPIASLPQGVAMPDCGARGRSARVVPGGLTCPRCVKEARRLGLI